MGHVQLHRDLSRAARAELTSILEAEGFTAVQWHMPPDTGFYQPIITARRPDPSSPHA